MVVIERYNRSKAILINRTLSGYYFKQSQKASNCFRNQYQPKMHQEASGGSPFAKEGKLRDFDQRLKDKEPWRDAKAVHTKGLDDLAIAPEHAP
jgi:hypothetical protein